MVRALGLHPRGRGFEYLILYRKGRAFMGIKQNEISHPSAVGSFGEKGFLLRKRKFTFLLSLRSLIGINADRG